MQTMLHRGMGLVSLNCNTCMALALLSKLFPQSSMTSALSPKAKMVLACTLMMMARMSILWLDAPMEMAWMSILWLDIMRWLTSPLVLVLLLLGCLNAVYCNCMAGIADNNMKQQREDLQREYCLLMRALQEEAATTCQEQNQKVHDAAQDAIELMGAEMRAAKDSEYELQLKVTNLELLNLKMAAQIKQLRESLASAE
eukprot:12427337-Karenia_brevis.AAC.1